MESQGILNSKNNLEKEGESWKTHTPDCRAHHEASGITPACGAGRRRGPGGAGGASSHVWVRRSSTGCRPFSEQRAVFSTDSAWKAEVHMHKREAGPSSHITCKISPHWVRDLNIGPKPKRKSFVKRLEENMGDNGHDLGLSSDF